MFLDGIVIAVNSCKIAPQISNSQGREEFQNSKSLGLAMAALSSTAAFPCCPWSQKLHANPRLRQRVIVAIGTKQSHGLLRSGFLAKLELRRTLVGRQLGRDGGQRRRLRRKVGVARAGLPVVSSIPVLGPVLNALFNPVVLFVLYAAGASRFWSGFKRTTYSDSGPTKLALTALWPALFIASGAFRSNFKNAVK